MQQFGPHKQPVDRDDDSPAGRTPRPAGEAVNRWETEGGRPAPEEQEAVVRPDAAREEKVEDVREELMAMESPEGRPPPATMRRIEWGALGLATVAALIAAWGLLTMQPRSAPWLVAWALVLLVTVPVWGAALLRGREERRAAREAKAVVREEGRQTPGRDATGTSGRTDAEESVRQERDEARPGG